MLQVKRYAKARKASIKLTKQMLDRLGANTDASKLFAQTVAIARSGQ